ncbi:host attachment protein [Methylocystis sp. SC2]|uniref:baeRF12 domain-containing protein n=1 Tax=Methylocystis sp. (strain SC2) TaxID=187303 RepID=UPI00027AEA18|nr:host attachment family protein [Methylocystis sp. SC2]CCJ07981.1 Host attachment protein [Methylocystis sp. SC2]
MSEFSVGNGAWVLVGDGRRALFFQNHGDAELLDLRVVETRIDDNPPTHEQGTDRPGRSFTSFSPGRSAVQNVDWHELEEERFARAMADRINQAAESGELDAIAIVAPPKALGEIRKELSVKAQSKVVGELAKDLTRHPLKDIEKALTRG